MDEQPSLVLIVEEAAFVDVTVSEFVSKVKPAPFPKNQLEASPCEKRGKEIIRKTTIATYFI